MCEIVQSWAGNFDNKFYYCREHKVEAISDSYCPGAEVHKQQAPSLDTVTAVSPWYAIENLYVGQYLLARKNIPGYIINNAFYRIISLNVPIRTIWLHLDSKIDVVNEEFVKDNFTVM